MNTEIIAIIDESGSMSSIRGEASSGFNSFVDEQRALPGQARLTLVTFDNSISTVYAARPLDSVPPFNLQPRGMTALLDAIGSTLDAQGARIKREGWADQVVVVIVTDGHENSSRRYNQSRVREMIGHAQQHGWAFVFLAANQDAFATARSYGIDERYTANFAATGQGARDAMAYATASVGAIRGTTY